VVIFVTEVKKERTQWIHCNRCDRDTEHLLVSDYTRDGHEWIDDDIAIDWSDSYNVWECRGCKDLVCEKTHQFSEDIDHRGCPNVYRNFYPERKLELLEPKEYDSIPDKLEELYEEIIKSYNQQCYVLCSIGLRMLIEAVCVEKDAKGRNFSEQIDNAEFIPVHIRKNLHGLRFLGNDAAHRLEKPSKKDLILAISVVEDILNIVYELDYKTTLIYKKFSKGRG
jgi:hypothetical protein